MPLQFRTAQFADSAITPAKLALSGTQTYNFGGDSITLQYKTPTNANEVTTKEYVDSKINGLYWKGACIGASTANLSATYNNGTSGVGATLTNADTQSAFSVDGVTFAQGDRVLIKNQTDAEHNGIYTITTLGNGSTNWVLTRAEDFDKDVEIPAGAVFIVAGTQGDQGFVCTNDEPPTIGTDNITFVQFTGVGALVAGDGLVKNADVISIDLSSNSGLILAGASANQRTLQINLQTNKGLVIPTSGDDAGKIAVDYDDATIGIISNKLAVKNDSLGLVKMSFRPEYDEFTSQSGTTVTLSQSVQSNFEKQVLVFRNGQVLRYKGSPSDNTEYSVSGNTVTFGASLDSNDVIGVYYLR